MPKHLQAAFSHQTVTFKELKLQIKAESKVKVNAMLMEQKTVKN